MRVLIVTETFEPSIDGVVTRLTHLVDHLCAEGHDVRVVAPALGVHLYATRDGFVVPVHGAKTVTVPFYPSRPFSLPWFSARGVTRRVADEFRPDVIHAVQPILLAQTGVWVAREFGVPLVASYHTNLPAYLARYPGWAWSAPIIQWATTRMHAHAEFNVVTSHAMRREIESWGIMRVRVVPRGIDTVQFHPSKVSAQMRERLGGGSPAANDARTVLLFVGRLAAEKDLESLVPLMKRRDDVALALVGDGPDRAELERAFAGTNTRFLGVMRGEELAAAYASADAFIFPSVTETLGLVIGEAMASGLPVIAARSGPIEEQIRDGKTGLLYSRASAAQEEAELDRAIATVTDAALAAPLRDAALAEAQTYSWSHASAEFLRVYEDAAAARAARRVVA